MDFDKWINEAPPGTDLWIVLIPAILGLLLLVLLLLYGAYRAVRAIRNRPVSNQRRKSKAVIKSKSESGTIEPVEVGAGDPDGPGVPLSSKGSGQAAGSPSVHGNRTDGRPVAATDWVTEAEIRPVVVGSGLSESSGLMVEGPSASSDPHVPDAWRSRTESPAPILDLASQQIDHALVSIPEYPVSMGTPLAHAGQRQKEAVAIAREDGLFDVYRQLPFLRAHLKGGLEPAELFFVGPGGDVVVNSHPYVLFQSEFAHDPEIRRRTEAALQTAAAGYMQRGLQRLAPVEREALVWTLRFLFWKGRLDKALSLVYRLSEEALPGVTRIRGLLGACLEEPLLHRAFPVSGELYDTSILGMPAQSIGGLRSGLVFQGATDTEDFAPLRPFSDLDRRNARWLYLYLIHRGYLFYAMRMCIRLARTDSSFEDESLYLAGIQGRYRLLLRLLHRLPARNSFFRLAVLSHALKALGSEEQEAYLARLRKHWPQVSREAIDSVEPFAEFKSSDSMRRNPGSLPGEAANPMDRSDLLDWMDLAAYKSRAGFHAGALNRAAVLYYTVLRSGRQARSGFTGRADRFFRRASRSSHVARHYYVLWLRDTERFSSARQYAEFFVRRYPDLDYFQEQFVQLSR